MDAVPQFRGFGDAMPTSDNPLGLYRLILLEALSRDRPSSDLGAVHHVIALESDLGNAVDRQAIPFGLCAYWHFAGLTDHGGCIVR